MSEVKGCPWCGKVPNPPREIVEGKVWSMGCEGHLRHSAGAMSWVSSEDCIAQWNNRHGAGDAEAHHEVLCEICGRPTMHLGPHCFTCTKAHKKAARAGERGMACES